jgi:hypothetical protein
MGEARARGTHEQHREDALLKAIDDAEVLVFLSAKDGGINLQILPRDEEPNADSLAVIIASWLNSNLEAITKAAVLAKMQSEQPAANVATEGGDMRVIASRPVRSVTTVEGGLANEAPTLLGPDGRAL